MPVEVDTGLATLSDQLVLAAVLLYVFAMIGFALQLGFGNAPARTAEPVRELAPVGGGPAGAEPPETVPTAPAAPVWPARMGTAGLTLTWLGWAVNLACIVTRGLAVDRWPWGNMYEFVVAICFAAVSTFLLMQLRYPVRFLGAFITMAATLGLGFGVRYLHVQAGPVVPALDTYWVAIHVSAAIVASGLFILGGVTSILFLIRKEGPGRLPGRAELERVAHRAVVIGFPIWTFAVIAGAMWADQAWGRYWGWDPKEVWAFITWVAYAAYLHARATAGWRGRAATIVQLVAFGCLLFNLIGVNMFLGGLHSYADVPG